MPESQLHDPWLIAAWPGMGSVALLASGYLLQHLSVGPPAELATDDLFPIQQVDVQNGIATASRRPRCLLFDWPNRGGEHDLIVAIGEAQPETGGYELCRRLIDYGIRRGVTRFFTFAAMATQLHLGGTPRVFATSTDVLAINEVRQLGVEILRSGQISGLNGVLLAAAAERGARALCLLGELPYFAIPVPNPRAAQAVLQRFTHLAGIEIDFTDLSRQAQAVEQHLQQLLSQMQQAASEAAESGEEPAEEPGEDAGETTSESPQATQPPEPPKPSAITPAVQRRIEALFEQARRDHKKAFELKHELDRLGIFPRYEDRFLDLFRKGA